VLLIAAGAASAHLQVTGDAAPLTITTIVGSALASTVITGVYFRLRRGHSPASIRSPELVQFAVFPFEPFLEAIAAIRWRTGDSRPLDAAPQTLRPIVVIDAHDVTVWEAETDSLPMLRFPTSAVESVGTAETRVQVSRIPIRDRVTVIRLEVVVGRDRFALPLPATEPQSTTVLASARARESLVRWIETVVSAGTG
jgi:hypothetical protein